MQKKFNILVILAVLFISEVSLGVKEVIFRQQTQVYSKRNENSEVLGVYDRGDTVPISSKTYGAWRKVIVDVSGKKKAGWILAKDIRGARIKDSKARQIEEDEKDGEIGYRRRTGVGIIGNLSYIHQSEGSISYETTVANANPSVEFSSMSGANVFVSLFGDYNWSDTMAIRGFFSMRKAKRSGTAGIPEISGGTGTFTIDQSMIGLGATLKFYDNRNSIFWWGPGLEVAKTTEMKITGSNDISSNISSKATEEPMFAIVSVSAGYDLHLSGRFFILPEAKFGLIPNGDPMAMVFEVLIPIAFTF